MPKLSTEERFWSKVNKTETCWEWTCSTMHGYGRMSVKGQYKIAHRLAWQFMRGPIPDGLVLDHLCHNKVCVNPGHLRAVTQAENQQNRRGPQRTNSTGIRGVSWCKRKKKWRSQLKKGGVNVHNEYFDDIEEASEDARLAREKHFGLKEVAIADLGK